MLKLQPSDTARISLIVCLLTLAGCSSDTAKPILECPEPHPLSGNMALEETQSDIKAIGTRLTENPAADVVNEVIFNLKREHPSASAADIVNYLVTAYCPTVAAETWLSKDDATAKVDQFSAQVNGIISDSN